MRQRGMTEADARARVAAQADDEARRAAADVWLDNSGAPADAGRRGGRAVAGPAGAVRATTCGCAARRRPDRARWSTPDPRWAGRRGPAGRPGGRGGGGPRPRGGPRRTHRGTRDAGRGRARPAAGGGRPGRRRRPAGRAGRRRVPPGARTRSPPGGTPRPTPGRPARVVVRPVGSPEWRNALLHRDWLRAGSPGGSSLRRPPIAPSPDTLSVAESWADSSGWRPPMR